MTSIRTYEGEIRLCSSCGQPCFYGDSMVATGVDVWQHFSEQWDGVHCPVFPLADDPLKVDWDYLALETLKEQYRDTYPHRV